MLNGEDKTFENRRKLLKLFSALDLPYSTRVELAAPMDKQPEKLKEKIAEEILQLISDCKTPEEMLGKVKNYKFCYNRKVNSANKDFCPMWALDFPNYSDQHDACFIWRKKDKAYCSLLPIRFYLDGDYYYEYDGYHNDSFYVKRNNSSSYADIEYSLCAEIISAEFAFAEMLYEKSAELLIKKFPEIENISFEKQKANGIYPIRWSVPYDVLLSRQLEIMKGLLDSGMYLDETLEETEDKDEFAPFPTVYLKGTLEGDFFDIIDVLKETARKDYLKVFGKKRLTYTLEECMKFYKIFPEEILGLGNQKRVYRIIEEQNRDMFDAAVNLDAAKLLTFVETGRNLNDICEDGNTVFSKYLNGIISGKGYPNSTSVFCEEDAQALVDAGANPALYGVDDDFEFPLNNALRCEQTDIVEFLLKNKVNPNMFSRIDCVYESETLLEREERWLKEIPYRASPEYADKLEKKGRERMKLLEEAY